MLDSTRAVGDFTVQNAMRLKRLVVEVLKATAKCWAFFKDVHFSFYVIIPVISSFTSLGQTESLLLWGLFFLPILIVITFMALDSIFDFSSVQAWPDALRPHSSRREEPPSIIGSPSGATRARARSHGYAPMQSRIHASPARRHRALRPLRSRRPGFW